MKNGVKNKSVAFIILVSIYIYKICVCMCYDVTGSYSETNKTETKDAHDQSISLSLIRCLFWLVKRKSTSLCTNQHDTRCYHY